MEEGADRYQTRVVQQVEAGTVQVGKGSNVEVINRNGFRWGTYSQPNIRRVCKKEKAMMTLIGGK